MQIYSPEVCHGSTSLPVTRRSEGIKPLCAFTHQNPNKTSANKRREDKGEDYQEVSGYPEKITDLRVMKNIWEISPPLWQHPEVIYLSGIVTHGEWGAPSFKLGKANFRKNGTFASEMPIGSGLSARCKLSSVYAQITSRRRLYAVISYFIYFSLQVLSSGVFELKIHSFHTAQRICRRHRDCHIFFRICLKHPEDVISAEPPCTFGTGQTNVIRADHTSISSSAPIRVPFHFKWPVNK